MTPSPDLRLPEDATRFDAVLFDFHSTLVDQGDAGAWLELAWARAERTGTARAALGEARFSAFAGWLDRIWERVREVDPHTERDLSSVRHREVYDVLIARSPEPDPALAEALYLVMLENWTAYDDTLPTLRALKARGLKLGLVSNVGFDVRSVLTRGGLDGLFDAVILSFEAGAVKPGAEIFRQALAALGVDPEHALMVGDSPQDDAGAALIGIRTLILPRTRGRSHGLGLVLRLVGRE
jgi:HAD superfamily hydrolase (TIGR01509 family)